MSKDCLQLEGDIHILNEKISALTHDNNEKLIKINQRMDSFVNQITEHKERLLNITQNNFNELKRHVKEHKESLSPLFESEVILKNLDDRLNELEKQDSRTINDIGRNSKMITDLKRELTLSLNDFKLFSNRISEIEKNFTNFNCDKIFKEIDRLELEYQQKVSQVISNISANIKLKFDGIDVNYLLKPIDELNLAVRTTNVLKTEKLKFIGDIVCNIHLKWDGQDYCDLMKTPNFVKKSMRELKQKLYEIGYKETLIYPRYWEIRKEITKENFDGRINLPSY